MLCANYTTVVSVDIDDFGKFLLGRYLLGVLDHFLGTMQENVILELIMLSLDLHLLGIELWI